MTVCSSGLFSMATDSSGEESVFTGCASSGVERGQGGVRRRQVSVPELMKRAAARKSKRSAPGRGSRSPPDAAAPAAKRPAAPARPSAAADGQPAPAGAAAPAAMELSAAALSAIQRLIDAGNARVISALDAKIGVLERRVALLEGECMDKDAEIGRLNERLEQQGKALEDLQARAEGIDANRRLSSLILTCEDFAASTPDEI